MSDYDGYLDNNKQVHISMFKENRDKIFYLINKKVNTQGSAIILQGGKDVNIYDTDVEQLFRQESFFTYLFAINEPGYYGAIDLTKNESILFIPKFDESYTVWMGTIKPTDYYKEKYGIDYVYYVDEIANIMIERSINLLYVNVGKNINSDLSLDETQFDGIEQFALDESTLYPLLCECRMQKSEKELNLLRFVNQISSEAHIYVMKQTKYCNRERDLESEFLYYISRKYGCRYVSYTCVCCSGINGAILHYGHAGEPNRRTFFRSDMLLLDMGAEYFGYDSDITCSFPVNGKFTQEQKDIYNAVLNTQKRIEAEIKSGAKWSNLQKICLQSIAYELINIGLVYQLGKTLDELIDLGIPQLFMPHKFGHLLGLDTHDVYTVEKNTELKTNMVITNEPGIYFMQTLLTPAFESEKEQFLNKTKIDQYAQFGGVRLEDDIIVLENGCENITKVPRTIDEVENVMKKDVILFCEPCK